MRRSKRHALLSAVSLGALVLLALAGCGERSALVAARAGVSPSPDPTSAGVSASPDPNVIASQRATMPVWQPSPPAPGEIIYPGFGVRTLPAPADLTPAVTLQDALKNPDVADFQSGGLAPGTPDASLRLFSNGDVPPDSSAPPNPVRLRPVWVLTYRNSPADYHGPVGFVPPSPRPMCDFFIAIDATTGTTLLLAQDCSTGAVKSATAMAK